MARAPFSIVERKRNAGRVFVARFFDSDGKVLKETTFPKARSRTAAAREAERILREGVLSNAANPDALTYLLSFWTRSSDYVRGRALRGVDLSEAYLSITRCVINKHVAPHVKGNRLLDLDADFAERLVLDLSASGAKPRTVNAAIAAVRLPMKYFCKRNRLANPLAEVERLKEHHRERGVLSVAELQKIVVLDESPRVKAGVLLAALCGLRLGECCGLKPEDVDKETSMLTIRNNYVEADGLKGPKGSRPGSVRVRQVPLPKPVLDAIETCEKAAPEDAAFVIWNGKDPTKPADPDLLQAGFKRVLSRIGIDENKRKTRNIVFHGLRHTFVSLQRASGIPDFVTARMSGHRSVEMLDNYSRGADNVVDFGAAREAIDKAMTPKKAVSGN